MKKIWILLSAFLAVFLFLELETVFSFLPQQFDLYLKIALVAFVLIFYVVSYLLFRKTNTVISEKKNIPYAVCAALLSLSVIFFSIYRVYSFLVLKTVPVSQIKFFSSVYFHIGYSVLGLLAAIYFCTVSISEFCGEKHYIQHPIFSLMPSLWFCYGLIVLFSEKIATSGNVKDSVKVLALVFSMLFVFFKAKKTCFNEPQDNMSALFGLLGFVFSFSFSVGFIVSFIIAPSAFSSLFAECIVMLMMSLYELFYLTSLRLEKN